MTSPDSRDEGDGATEPGEADAGPGTAATLEAAKTQDGGALQVDPAGEGDRECASSLAADDDAAVSGPSETDKLRAV